MSHIWWLIYPRTLVLINLFRINWMDKFRFRRRPKEKCFVWRGRFTKSCSRFGPPSFRFVNPSLVLRVVRSRFTTDSVGSDIEPPLKWFLIHLVIFDQSYAGNFQFKKGYLSERSLTCLDCEQGKHHRSGQRQMTRKSRSKSLTNITKRALISIFPSKKDKTKENFEIFLKKLLILNDF